MKKFTLLMCAVMFCLLNVNAQQYVSTAASYKNVLIEEFTGRNCPNCPAGHIISNSITHNNPDRAWSIGIHSGYFAVMTYPNFNTDISAVLTDPYDDVSGGLGYPAAVINRSTEQALSRGQWEAEANTQLQQMADCNVAGHVVINPITRTASITTEVYYTSNSAETTNYLTILMVQDSIAGQQAYAHTNPAQDLGDDMYCHMHVLRDVVTADWGDEIAPTTEGSLITKTYEYIIPDTIGDPNGVYVDIDNIHFIAFVTEKYQGMPTRPILNVNKLSQEQSSGLAVSPFIADVMIDDAIYCTNERTFKTYVKNIGSEELTSLKFEVEYEGGETVEHSWTGNIVPDATERIDITFDVPVGNNEYVFNIVEANGETHDYSKSIMQLCDEWAVYETGAEEVNLTIEVLQDKSGNHTTWELMSSDNTVLISGGPYMYLPNANTELHTYNVDVNVGDCYKFVIYDSFGNGICCEDGDGYYKITDADGYVIIDELGQFTHEKYSIFSVIQGEAVQEMNTPLYNIYPNPAEDVVKLSVVNAKPSVLKIYNVVGMMIEEIEINSDEVEINVADYNSGIYFFNVDGEVVKVIIEN